MVHRDQHIGGIVDELVARFAFDMCDETYTTVFFLIGRIIKAMSFGQVKKWLHGIAFCTN